MSMKVDSLTLLGGVPDASLKVVLMEEKLKQHVSDSGWGVWLHQLEINKGYFELWGMQSHSSRGHE